jgi:lysophospholipase L1-like esterase
MSPAVRSERSNAAAGRSWLWVALGDSTGLGVGARAGGYVARVHDSLRRRGLRVDLRNLCRSGATSRDVRAIAERSLPRGIDFATLAVGINDLHRGIAPEIHADAIDAILTRLRAHGARTIIVANLPDASLAPVVPAGYRAALAKAIERLNDAAAPIVAGHGATLVDLHGPSRTLLAASNLFCGDGFHPSDAGYEAWAEIMRPVVEAALEAAT